ncbi:lipid A deacylase LpxR family protein, partial [Marinobacter sp. 71-i]|nr:lipid A deacylase LpxR family protein [Marinobacter iranensis]
MNFRFLAFSLVVASLVLASGAHAESADSVVALSMDNDLFAPTQTDRDYTAGVAITYSSNSKEFISNPVSRVSQAL